MLYAFIDEAGQRSSTALSSNHFVMSAVVISDRDVAQVAGAQARLRVELGRRPGDALHWRNLRTHSLRLHAAGTLGAMPVVISSVVVCKRALAPVMPSDDHAYLYTLRFLLERLSWFSRDQGAVLDYTVAHVVRFRTAKLRDYEHRLQRDPSCKVSWRSLNPHGGRLDQPSRVEQLQLAHIAASATFQAFEPDSFGYTEQRYLQSLRHRLYRRQPGELTSYGLKMHPWNTATRAAYPWVAAL